MQRSLRQRKPLSAWKRGLIGSQTLWWGILLGLLNKLRMLTIINRLTVIILRKNLMNKILNSPGRLYWITMSGPQLDSLLRLREAKTFWTIEICRGREWITLLSSPLIMAITNTPMMDAWNVWLRMLREGVITEMDNWQKRPLQRVAVQTQSNF